MCSSLVGDIEFRASFLPVYQLFEDTEERQEEVYQRFVPWGGEGGLEGGCYGGLLPRDLWFWSIPVFEGTSPPTPSPGTF